MKTFCFTVDDNVRFLKQLSEGEYQSIFQHPYLAVFKRLHERFGLKVQLNLFYRLNGFTLEQATAAYRDEWAANADWLKLSFHSQLENYRPYEHSGYGEVYADCKSVHTQILRFAGSASLAKTTTVHYCLATKEGLNALADNGVKGLLGLFGDSAQPRTSYGVPEEYAARIRNGEAVRLGAMCYGGIDIVLNEFTAPEIEQKLDALSDRNHINVMIHEQYFYPDYKNYQPDYEQKLCRTFALLQQKEYTSKFFEQVI